MSIDNRKTEYYCNCKKLREYIDRINDRIDVKEERNVSKDTLDIALTVWEKLRHLCESVGVLSIPSACVGSDDNFMYTWSNSVHYMECEIFGSGEIEFFYRNKNNGEVWGKDVCLNRGFEEIFDKAVLFCMHNL